MNWIVTLIHWVNGFVGNMGWTIVLIVCITQLCLVPVKLFARKNNKAKTACTPAVRAIQKKYNANQLGVPGVDCDDMPEYIRAMNMEERAAKMAQEIDETYKEYGYNLWLSWLPLILNLAVLLGLWMGIKNASIDNMFYSTTFKTLNSIPEMDYSLNIMLLISPVIMSCVASIVSAILQVIKQKKQQKPIKAIMISSILSCIISVALSLWIITSISTAIAIALTTLYACSFIGTIISSIFKREDAEASKLS